MKKQIASTINDVLNAVPDRYSIQLLEAIAKDGKGKVVAETLQMSREVFYTRMADLARNGLIIGRNGKYSLTGFGRIIYNMQMTIAKAGTIVGN